LAEYRRDLAALGDILTQSEARAEVDPAIVERARSYAARMPEAATSLSPRLADMPYRRLRCRRICP